ncbi:MAG: hypothetical protein KGI54_13180 [Pseudomonadota bacterium]|nr:hypothetical protein [Pseudomonadota bacterium]
MSVQPSTDWKAQAKLTGYDAARDGAGNTMSFYRCADGEVPCTANKHNLENHKRK